MNRIKEVIKEKGLSKFGSLTNLVKATNMVNGYVQNRQQPRLGVLNDIAKILNVDI